MYARLGPIKYSMGQFFVFEWYHQYQHRNQYQHQHQHQHQHQRKRQYALAWNTRSSAAWPRFASAMVKFTPCIAKLRLKQKPTKESSSGACSFPAMTNRPPTSITERMLPRAEHFLGCVEQQGSTPQERVQPQSAIGRVWEGGGCNKVGVQFACLHNLTLGVTNDCSGLAFRSGRYCCSVSRFIKIPGDHVTCSTAE